MLKQHGKSALGVKQIIDTIKDVSITSDGAIDSLTLATGTQVNADLFIDCSGFSSLLLGQALNVPFIPKKDQLSIDSALATHVAYPADNDAISCQTKSTAQANGWVWDIGLQSRRGVGYVYDSELLSESDARQVLANYIGIDVSELIAKKITFEAGHREKFWQKNCVAVGLSAGFLEPLEASALMLIETAAEFIAEQLPVDHALLDITAKRFNETFLYRWEKIIDFLKLHYVLSKRDEPFWQKAKAVDSISDSLKNWLAIWRYRAPQLNDFDSNFEIFPAASYQYVLYGMGFDSDFEQQAYLHQTPDKAAKLFSINQQAIAQASARLPKHRELLNLLKQHKFQSI